MFSPEQIHILFEALLARDWVKNNLQEGPAERALRSSGWSEDPETAKIQAALSIMLEAAMAKARE